MEELSTTQILIGILEYWKIYPTWFLPKSYLSISYKTYNERNSEFQHHTDRLFGPILALKKPLKEPKSIGFSSQKPQKTEMHLSPILLTFHWNRVNGQLNREKSGHKLRSEHDFITFSLAGPEFICTFASS